jgi:negative regulator of sigma E activity
MLVTETSLLAEQMRESISAMVDNEAQQIELQRVLKATEDEPAVRDQWQRYQLVSGLLKRQTQPLSVDTELADKVRSAVAEETSQVGAKLAPTWNFWKPVGGFAIAASATMMMVLGVQQATLVSQADIVDESGIVLLEPGQFNSQFEQVSIDSGVISVTPEAQDQQLNGVMAIDSKDALWSIADLPQGFVLVNHQLEEFDALQREMFIFSNGNSEFTIYVEPLRGRTIAEGHAYVAQDLVLGQSVEVAGDELFVTFVGGLPLADAEQVAASVVVNTPQ